MKVGLGLYKSMLTRDNFRFAKQAGATHIIVHWVDYFADADSLSTGSGDDVWGVSSNQDQLWTAEELIGLRKSIEAEGLTLAGIENIDPSHWYDILLDGPSKEKQLEGIKTMIRNLGKAGIPTWGYYFSIAGVWGRTSGASARGDATAVGYIKELVPEETPIPNGQIWNMVYDPNASEGFISPISQDDMWERLKDFLEAIIPVAEEAGVRMAAHPDDPPLPTLRGADRLIYKAQNYQRLLDIAPSHHNALEFCVGTLSEMPDSDIYEVVEQYASQKSIAYVHLRNVVGKAPNYHEVFLDEGDTDMYRVLEILNRNNFEGVIIPDHTPLMTCDAPWHAGMAYALGWMNASIAAIKRSD